MILRTTHTYVELEISEAAYKEIRAKLMAADYSQCFEIRDRGEDGTGPIDMSGLAVIPARAAEVVKGPPCNYVYGKETSAPTPDIQVFPLRMIL